MSFALLGPYRYEILRHILARRVYPNLKNPVTFSEKLSHRKLYDHNPIYPKLVDKYQVRDFVRVRVGGEILSRLYFVGSQPETINIQTLPDQFVIKATHGSGPDFISFVEDKNLVSLSEIQAICALMLRKPYGRITNEWWYQQVPPRIIIEEFLRDQGTGIPLDYKFFVFHGKVEVIQVDYARFQRHMRTFYDRDWNPLNLRLKYPKGPISDRPAKLAEMIEISESLGKDFDFIRVDLYCVNNERVVFGELTLSPEAGWGRFSPASWDVILGAKW